MYVAGTPQSLPSSEAVLRGSSVNSGTTYKGAMSKRFDGRDEQTSLSKPLNVSLFHTIFYNSSTVIQSMQSPASSKGDEAAAMAAMFQAQTQNWEEAQEKMSQLVLPIAGFCLYVVQNLMMNLFFLFFFSDSSD